MPPTEKTVIVVQHRQPVTLTMAEWRQQPHLVAAARKALNSQDFQAMVEVLRNEHFANYMMGSGTIEERAVVQARGEGYSACLNNLAQLAVPFTGEKILEPTFEPAEEPITNTK